MSFPEVFILSGARAPTGKFQGSLQTISAPQLGAHAIRAAVARAALDPQQIDEALLGNVVSAGLGQAPARQAALGAGLPDTINATLVNKVCGSSLKTVMLGAAMLRAGDANAIVAGGFESMSRGPYLSEQLRGGARMGDVNFRDAVVFDALTDPFRNWHMGNAAEFIAQTMQVTRAAQDEYALRSHQRAHAAQQADKFADEIAPIEIALKGGVKMFDADETIRADTSLEALAKLKPAFQKEGVVTAGNAPGWSDGAAALILANANLAKEHKPIARVAGYHQSGTVPEKIFWAPIDAINGLLKKLTWKLDDVDLFELNEAFAAQVLADGNALGWDWNKVNVNGGAIALGHPLGASGARILVTLLYELKRRGGKRGIASACLGGGEAVAVAIEIV